jgi:unsaturated rhamnogalacturonyl hydrolase
MNLNRRLRAVVHPDRKYRFLPLIIATIGIGASLGMAKPRESWSARMAHSLMARCPDSIWYVGVPKSLKWDYERGVVLEGIAQLYNVTHDAHYQAYIKKQIDQFIPIDGSIRTYDYSSFNLDNIATGRLLLSLFAWTGEERYKTAADTLRKQLANQPRTKEGGFWHKKIYPNQMWLDGLYMAEPFYAQYASMFGEDSDFKDIADQFIFMENHARDSATGLLFHGWDESREQRWSNPATGRSSSFWGRAMGWYGMGLVDALDWLPQQDPQRPVLIAILRRFASALTKYRDTSTGVWFQVVDKPLAKGNYPEASASCMFVYTLAKGVRQGYLDASYLTTAKSAFRSIVSTFVTEDKDGYLSLQHTCESAGLGGRPYRDGSYDYYLSEPQRTNDFKGIGAFLMASNEIERTEDDLLRRPKVVMLDYFYNCEWKQEGTTKIQYHYIWEDTANSGFSILGSVITGLGASLGELHCSPVRGLLDQCSVYVVVDPDTPAETKDPHYISDVATREIVDWVHDGGVLVLMGNDKGNAEFAHLNNLAQHFGIHFNEDSYHRVVDNKFEMGKFSNFPDHPIFYGVSRIYLKEICSLAIEKPAEPILAEDEHVFMASARFGRGTVFAVGDPWLYNEYIDNRKLPSEFENKKGASRLFQWLLERASLSTN